MAIFDSFVYKVIYFNGHTSHLIVRFEKSKILNFHKFRYRLVAFISANSFSHCGGENEKEGEERIEEAAKDKFIENQNPQNPREK